MPDAPQDPLDAATDAAGSAEVDAAGALPDAGVDAGAIAPLDVDGVRAVTVGTVLWTIAFVACLLGREQLAAAGNAWWTWVCLTGALLGLPGLWYVRRRARAYARS